MHIGFEQDTGHVYEGVSAPRFAVWPSPVLSQAKLIEQESDWNDLPKGLTQSPFAWVSVKTCLTQSHAYDEAAFTKLHQIHKPWRIRSVRIRSTMKLCANLLRVGN